MVVKSHAKSCVQHQKYQDVLHNKVVIKRGSIVYARDATIHFLGTQPFHIRPHKTLDD